MTIARNFYNLNSRVHALKMFGKGFYLKRDDELGGLISGSKWRKYSSLIPFLLEKRAKEVAVIGSMQSNNVIGLCACLLENGIIPTLFLLDHHVRQVEGNYALIDLFGCQTRFIPRDKWGSVCEIAGTEFKHVIPEGANHIAAASGAETLVDDILRNEQELGLSFDRIFLDAGTGFQARCAIKRASELKSKWEIHVVAVAKGVSIEGCKLHASALAPSFGSINRSVIEWVRKVACEEGVVVDPVYSAKLFATVAQLQQKDSLHGNTLIVHSGLSPAIGHTFSKEGVLTSSASSMAHSRS